jgi:hypothetical protein
MTDPGFGETGVLPDTRTVGLNKSQTNDPQCAPSNGVAYFQFLPYRRTYIYAANLRNKSVKMASRFTPTATRTE